MSVDIHFQPFGTLLKKVIDNRGRTCPVVEQGMPLIATNCVTNDYLYPQFEKVRFVNDETYKNWFRGHPEPGDIIFVLKGTPGRVAWVPNPVGFCIAQDMVAIRADEKKIYPKYLFAALRSTTIQQEIEGLHVGSLIPHFKKGDFDDLKIPIVEPSLQKFIGDQYFQLSLKIDLLHRQNKTLEAMAETLFRQWFLEGAGDAKPALLGDYVEIFNGVSYKSDDLQPSKTAMVTLKSFDRNGGFRMDGFKEYTGKHKPEHVVEQGDLVVAHTDITQDAAVIGNPILVVAHPAYDKLVISMDLVKVKSKYNWLTNEFLYVLMRTGDFKQHCLGYSNGSTVLHLSKKAIPSYEFNLPSMEKAQKFSLLAKNLFSKKFKNIEQVRSLEKLRDGLLPKLMSGEVSVA